MACGASLPAAAAGIGRKGRKIDLVECQKYLATYAYSGREREEFTRITRVLNARLGMNGPCLRDVYLGSSFFCLSNTSLRFIEKFH